MFEAEFVSKDSDQTETAPNGEQAPMVYPGKEPRASDSVLAAAGMRVTARYSGAADDLCQCAGLPTCRSNIALGGHLSAGLAHASAQANGRKPAGHGEAHSSAGERHGGRASGGRWRQGNEQD